MTSELIHRSFVFHVYTHIHSDTNYHLRDCRVYQKDYLDLDLNWRVFDERTIEFAQGKSDPHVYCNSSDFLPTGMTLHHLPGHTEGLMGLQMNRKGYCASKELIWSAQINC